MFGARTRSDVFTEGEAPKRRREGRGLGPFSGGQLTVIIVTLAVLLLFPVGAWALSFSNVAITDPGGVNQAKVDSGKNLHAAVADPGGVNVAKVDAKNNLNTAIHDAGTGTAAKVNGLGQLTVNASVGGGSINATPRPVTNFTHFLAITPGSTPTVIAHGLGSTGMVVTQITVDFWQATASGPSEQINFYLAATLDGTCNSVGNLLMDVNPAAVGLQTIQLNPGLTLFAGQALCANTTDSGNVNADVTVFGYQV
jgi:hypothetical protein